MIQCTYNAYYLTITQALLEHNQSAHTAIAVLEGENLLEEKMEVQYLIPLDFGLELIIPDQRLQTGIDPIYRQQLPVPESRCHSPVLTGTHLLAIGIHRTGHQDLFVFLCFWINFWGRGSITRSKM